ncbi:hypothetical protein FACS1894126_6230 [Alphaproteobacteria bacterium]|nr:hypothetical protein FACS1894126_6230 [Alphaproteobacteria bacterium]
MKRLVIGAAIAIMLTAGIVDVDAKVAGTGSGKSNVKTRAGHNNADTTKLFEEYYSDAKKDAEKARAKLKDLKSALAKLKKEKKAQAKEIGDFEAAAKKFGIALESIEKQRKVDDIKPDCEKAAKAYEEAAKALAKKIGSETAKKIFAPLKGCLVGPDKDPTDPKEKEVIEEIKKLCAVINNAGESTEKTAPPKDKSEAKDKSAEYEKETTKTAPPKDKSKAKDKSAEDETETCECCR